MGQAGILRTLEGGAFAFYCPGCRQMHAVGKQWAFNGDFDYPTFSPSIAVSGVRPLTDEEYARVMAGELVEPKPSMCHSFVRNGWIEFLQDCTHELAGQSKPLVLPRELHDSSDPFSRFPTEPTGQQVLNVGNGPSRSAGESGSRRAT